MPLPEWQEGACDRRDDRLIIRTTLTMTNHYASLNVKQLQQSHDLYSLLRAKETGSERESAGSGYWDIE